MVGIKRKQAPTTPGILTEKKIKKAGSSVQKLDAARPQREAASHTTSSAKPKTIANRAKQDILSSDSDEESATVGPSAQERGEAETDSDPIVESDTTEHSGGDDGVSWPSDEEEEIGAQGVQVNEKAIKAPDAVNFAKPAKAKEATKDFNDASTGM